MKRWVIFLTCCAAVWSVSCSGFTEFEECTDGDQSSCDSQCGLGTMTCVDGSWGECLPDVAPGCMPGEYGTCELEPDQPPGLWYCSDTCQIGPCIQMCNPGDTYECNGDCGIGQTTCQDDGSWGECVEYIIPNCQPGDVEVCRGEEGAGHWRCTDSCVFGPCEISMDCFPGEIARCDNCASQECGSDGTWQECVPFPGRACIPGTSESCDGPCGPGFRICGSQCEWSDCESAGGCTPGQRQICPAMYCGVSYRVCGPNCVWTPCIEAGY